MDAQGLRSFQFEMTKTEDRCRTCIETLGCVKFQDIGRKDSINSVVTAVFRGNYVFTSATDLARISWSITIPWVLARGIVLIARPIVTPIDDTELVLLAMVALDSPELRDIS